MRLLVIAPHPDDETLGCGGTLLKHRASGDEIVWCIVTCGYEPRVSSEFLANREKEIAAVGAAYGCENVIKLDHPTTRLDTIPREQLIDDFHRVIETARPQLMYLNHAGDVHSDHRVIFEAVMSAVKPFNTFRHGVKKILSYEVPSSTDASIFSLGRPFVPTVYSDITSYIEDKLRVFSLYPAEVQPYPQPRSPDSVKALARMRGSTIGVEYAEAFMLLRDIV
jgi:LmbE family N-acetylglucosaminyl deacetylase